jgi:hypothetical protein
MNSCCFAPHPLEDGLFLNVHAPEFPGGQIRGQIIGVDDRGNREIPGAGIAGAARSSARRTVTFAPEARRAAALPCASSSSP